MKKLVFGCALMLFGAICGTGWIIAWCILVGPDTQLTWTFPVATVLNAIWGKLDLYIALLFYIISGYGAFTAIKELKKD